MSKSEALRCFVISPIGAEGSETRRHADTVYECLIKPACADSFGQGGPVYHPERGDHKTAPGKITDQIYEDILAADLIIAVLTESNPNVYYELAIAQSAAKPVILLLEKGFAAPFDIKDQRIIYYDFEAQSIFNGTYAKLLRSSMNAVAENSRRPIVPFAPHLVPLGDPLQTIGDRASEGEDVAIEIVRSARRYVYLMGYSLSGWLMNESFAKALKSAGNATRSANKRDERLEVRVILMGQNNAALPLSMKTKTEAKQVHNAAGRMPTDWMNFLGSLKGLKPKVKTLDRYNLGYQAIFTENAAISVPYLVSRGTMRSPFISAKRNSAYFDTMKEEFVFLWENANRIKPTKTKK
ncbi:MAG: hypothetical protein NXH72_14090 [Hyphomonadaceae bacterium]|nr:hypothetical protein [Hyphomonadaceae bacterium]